MWAIGRYDLRLTDEEFGVLTPALFEALLDRKEQERKLQYIYTGILAAAVVNFSPCAPEKRVTALDFVPEQYLADEERGGVDLRTLSPEEQVAYVRGQMSKKIYRRR